MKLGFLLSHIGDAEVSKTFIKKANEFLCSHQDVDIIGFVANQVSPTIHPSFATMNINEAFDYNGAVVATNLAMAEKIVNFPGPRKKYYYLWELDWTKETGRTFEELLALFHNPKLSIIARTPEDKMVIERCWNCRVQGVIPDCDIGRFVELVRKDEN